MSSSIFHNQTRKLQEAAGPQLLLSLDCKEPDTGEMQTSTKDFRLKWPQYFWDRLARNPNVWSTEIHTSGSCKFGRVEYEVYKGNLGVFQVSSAIWVWNMSSLHLQVLHVFQKIWLQDLLWSTEGSTSSLCPCIYFSLFYFIHLFQRFYWDQTMVSDLINTRLMSHSLEFSRTSHMLLVRSVSKSLTESL